MSLSTKNNPGFLSRKLMHFFHVVSNIRPIVWIGIYIGITPIFALIYWWLPDTQFRIPDNAGTDYGSWLYYSIVTITTLGFGDYTPAHAWAQAVTAVEVMCGLVFLGFFLNAVGSMKSEIDVESEIEKQHLAHEHLELDKFMTIIPSVMHNLNLFLSYCYAVTTPLSKRNNETVSYNPDFTFNDMADLFEPSGLPSDRSNLPAVVRFMHISRQTSLCLDSLQSKVDLAIWPDVLEDCFGFVASYEMFSSEELLLEKPSSLTNLNSNGSETDAQKALSEKIANWKGPLDFKAHSEMQIIGELYHFIKENAGFALKLESALTKIANS
ncbi:MAG: two pore domain potassium channel family protein [Bacteroides sp.]|nr:two pore domain potassium channel family protein [Bacteroides sp.]